jgi:hypothetical protein
VELTRLQNLVGLYKARRGGLEETDSRIARVAANGVKRVLTTSNVTSQSLDRNTTTHPLIIELTLVATGRPYSELVGVTVYPSITHQWNKTAS